LALTWPTGGGRSVGIVRLRTKGHGVFLFQKIIVALLMVCLKYKNDTSVQQDAEM
jgi:hypothetical protein